MNIWKEHNKIVTYDTMDGIVQKIDKCTVMMAKLVTDDKGKNSLICESINPTEVEDRQDAITSREDFRTDLGQTTHIEEGQGRGKIMEVGQDMILIIGVTTETI